MGNASLFSIISLTPAVNPEMSDTPRPPQTTNSITNENFSKLKEKLRELFQLDRGDLDFGLYRIMAHKSVEVGEFLENHLLPQVTEALGTIADADSEAANEELHDVIGLAQKLGGIDPEQTDAVKNARIKLAAAKRDQQTEADTYNHLYNFFSRYYDEGDFMSLRRYKSAGRESYSIPYNGEEVKLHWANSDQYYIKTTENYSSYIFTAGADKPKNRVRFEIAEADNEKDNIKETNGKQRFFILAKDFIAEEKVKKESDLIIRFDHRPLTEGEKKKHPQNGIRRQASINQETEKRIRAKLKGDWLNLLLALCPTEADEARTVLGKHLTAYTAKNSFDYFIHKDLGGFLRRELDFYLKSEVISIDNLELADDPTVFIRGLAQVKAIKRVGEKIIDFLAQLENFQKQLWLKKKLVLETQYCVTLDKVPESLYPAITKNKNQRDEWVKLFAIDQWNGDSVDGSTAYSKPLKPEFLKENPWLVLDTRHFDRGFTDKLLAALSEAGPIEEQMNGLLVHGENFQALNLLQDRYREQVKCVYIDPPYNTDDGDFAYKDNYMHSSWMSALSDRVALSREMISPDGQFISHIDEHEDFYLQSIVKNVFEVGNFLGVMVWNKRNPKGDAKGLAIQHESLVWAVRNQDFIRNAKNGLSRPKRNAHAIIEMAAKMIKQSKNIDEARKGFQHWIKQQPFSGGELAYKEIDEQGKVFRVVSMAWPNKKQAPKEYFEPLMHPVTKRPCPIPNRGWRNSPSTMKRLLREGLIIFGKDETTQPGRKYLLHENMSENIPSVFEYGGSADNEAAELGLFLDTMKPLAIAEYVCHLNQQSGNILDYFAGSGTTGHAVINLNRKDGGDRNYILVEIGHHFEDVLLPRMKKVIYAEKWKDGKPEDQKGVSQLFRYIRLESYEDALDSLTLNTRDDMFDNEDYQLRYALGDETKENASLLGKDFIDPHDYTLSVVRDGVRRDMPVDLAETFDFLLGLRLTGRRQIDDVLTIQGTSSKGENCLILWRNLQKINASGLDKWFTKHRAKFGDDLNLIYVNGDHTLNALRKSGDKWEAVTTEPVFRELMFSGAG